MNQFQYSDLVRTEWVDYNGHMNDAAYALVFSLTGEKLMEHIGLDEKGRAEHGYTIFTLETHVCYFQEAHKGEDLRVEMQLLDYDAKRLHVCFFMKNSSGSLLSTSEQMLMGIDESSGKPASFPAPVCDAVTSIWEKDQQKSRPVQAGRVIGIKKK